MEQFQKSKKSETKRKNEVPRLTKTTTVKHRKRATISDNVWESVKPGHSFECNTVCPVGVQNRVSSSKLSRPEHGSMGGSSMFIPFKALRLRPYRTQAFPIVRGEFNMVMRDATNDDRTKTILASSCFTWPLVHACTFWSCSRAHL